MTDTVLENTLKEGGTEKKASVFCKIIVVEFMIVLDPSRDTLKGKRGFSGGAHVLSWGLRSPTRPPSRSWCYSELSPPQGFPAGPWQALQRRSTQVSTVALSLSVHSVGKKGQCRDWEGEKAEHCTASTPWLAPSHIWHRGFALSHSGGTKRNYLACLGLHFSSL